MTHAIVPSIVAKVLARPARWAPVETHLGAYDGQERTLQVFNVEATEQDRCLEHLEPYLPSLEQRAGGPLVIIFLSARQSLRHAEFVGAFRVEPPVKRILQETLPALGPDCIDTDSQHGPHRKVA